MDLTLQVVEENVELVITQQDSSIDIISETTPALTVIQEQPANIIEVMQGIQGPPGVVDGAMVSSAVQDYLTANPVQAGVNFEYAANLDEFTTTDFYQNWQAGTSTPGDMLYLANAGDGTDGLFISTTNAAVMTVANSQTLQNLYVSTNRLVNGYRLGDGDVTLTKADISLDQVDNTSDLNKPISTAVQTALNVKQPVGDYATNSALTSGLSSKADTSALTNLVPNTTTVNGHALSSNVTVTKSDVSLGNVDNTSDVNKPVSTATQTALSGKANSVHTHVSNDISDATATGKSVLQAASAAAARTAIGAGTSNLAVGTTATDAKAGNYTPSIADLPAGSVLYSTSTSTRPTARTDIRVIFTTTTSPTAAISGDIWLNTGP